MLKPKSMKTGRLRKLKAKMGKMRMKAMKNGGLLKNLSIGKSGLTLTPGKPPVSAPAAKRLKGARKS